MTKKNHTTSTISLEDKFAEDLAFIRSLLAQNRPNPEDYETLNIWYDKIGKMCEAKTISEEETDYELSYSSRLFG